MKDENQTTSFRFTGPIDQNTAWEFAQQVVGVPNDFRHEHFNRGDPFRPEYSMFRENSGFHAGWQKGTGAIMWLEYGPQSSLLDDSQWDDEDISDHRPPAAYAELFIDTRPMDMQRDHTPWIGAIQEWSPVRVLWFQGVWGDEWHEATS